MDDTFWTTQRIVIVLSCASAVLLSFAFFIFVVCRPLPAVSPERSTKRDDGQRKTTSNPKKSAEEASTFAVISARS